MSSQSCAEDYTDNGTLLVSIIALVFSPVFYALPVLQ